MYHKKNMNVHFNISFFSQYIIFYFSLLLMKRNHTETQIRLRHKDPLTKRRPKFYSSSVAQASWSSSRVRVKHRMSSEVLRLWPRRVPPLKGILQEWQLLAAACPLIHTLIQFSSSNHFLFFNSPILFSWVYALIEIGVVIMRRSIRLGSHIADCKPSGAPGSGWPTSEERFSQEVEASFLLVSLRQAPHDDQWPVADRPRRYKLL